MLELYVDRLSVLYVVFDFLRTGSSLLQGVIEQRKSMIPRQGRKHGEVLVSCSRHFAMLTDRVMTVY